MRRVIPLITRSMIKADTGGFVGHSDAEPVHSLAWNVFQRTTADDRWEAITGPLLPVPR